MSIKFNFNYKLVGNFILFLAIINVDANALKNEVKNGVTYMQAVDSFKLKENLEYFLSKNRNKYGIIDVKTFLSYIPDSIEKSKHLTYE